MCILPQVLQPLLVGRCDNLQLFIFPLLKYEELLYNIIDDKKIWNQLTGTPPPPVQGSEDSTYSHKDLEKCKK